MVGDLWLIKEKGKSRKMIVNHDNSVIILFKDMFDIFQFFLHLSIKKQFVFCSVVPFLPLASS